MAKKRHIKHAKHAIRKMRNRIRRMGDSWYSKPWKVTQRADGKRQAKDLSE